MNIVDRECFSSVAFPAIGAGSGAFPQDRALELMLQALGSITSAARVVIVRFSGNACRAVDEQGKRKSAQRGFVLS